jgi:hypothetical protein
MDSKYFFSGYHVISGKKYTPEKRYPGHIIAFPTPLPTKIKDALEEHSPLLIKQT